MYTKHYTIDSDENETEQVWNVHNPIDSDINGASLKCTLPDRFRWQQRKFETYIIRSIEARIEAVWNQFYTINSDDKRAGLKPALTRSIQLRRGQVWNVHCYTIDWGKNRSSWRPTLLHDGLKREESSFVTYTTTRSIQVRTEQVWNLQYTISRALDGDVTICRSP